MPAMLRHLRQVPSWVFVILLFAAALSLGVYAVSSTIGCGGRPFWVRVHLALQLFVVGGEPTGTCVDDGWPVPLVVAAFLSPLVTVFAFLQLAWRDVRGGAESLWWRYVQHGHIVVCGLGEKGWTFARSCRRHGYAVIAVERDPNSPFLANCTEEDVHAIVGDALDPAMMRRSGLGRAKAVVAFCGNDGLNANLVASLRALLAGRPSRHRFRPRRSQGRVCKIVADISEIDVLRKLEEHERLMSKADSAAVTFTNVAETSARLLLRDHPPDVYADMMGQSRIHLAVYGFGEAAEAILKEAVLVCHGCNQARLRLTVFDPAAEQCERRLRQSYPMLDRIADVDFEVMAMEAGVLPPTALAQIPQSVTEHIVCLEPDEHAFAFALALRRLLLEERERNAPIMVRLRAARGLSKLFGGDRGGAQMPEAIYPFGDLVRALSPDIVLDQALDDLARKLHAHYLKKLAEDRTRSNWDKPAAMPWERLPEEYRKSNRLAADHVAVKLRAIRCHTAPSQDKPTVTLAEEEVEELARIEHDRWRAEKYMAGWSYDLQRVDPAKRHKNLMPWPQLSESVKDYDRAQVRAIPSFVKLRRQLVVGIAGHRPDKPAADPSGLRRRLDPVLDDLAARYRDRVVMILSTLAEGAERLVAELAMARLDARLDVILPLPFETYQRDFWHVGEPRAQEQADASMAAFLTLFGRAERYRELPLRFGNLYEVGQPGLARQQQYALAGAYMVERCDELIVVSDDEPEDGPGCPAQLLRWRRQGVVDSPYATMSMFHPRPATRPPIDVKLGKGLC